MRVEASSGCLAVFEVQKTKLKPRHHVKIVTALHTCPPVCTAGAAGNPVSVLFAGSSSEALQDPAVAHLSAWGYPVAACMEALQRLKGHSHAAHRDLFARLAGTASPEAMVMLQFKATCLSLKSPVRSSFAVFVVLFHLNLCCSVACLHIYRHSVHTVCAIACVRPCASVLAPYTL